jgi:uncharacterized lipoprotein NlpE involved in copper resistance
MFVKVFYITVVLSISLLSQSITNDITSTQNSLDWETEYVGYLPCSNCSAIELKLILHEDMSYTKKEKYLGQNDDLTLISGGRFIWNKDGSTIELKDKTNILVGEDSLVFLNINAREVENTNPHMYVLNKIGKPTLFNVD